MTKTDLKILWKRHKKLYITLAVLIIMALLSPLAYCRIDDERVFKLTTSVDAWIGPEDMEQLQRLPLLRRLSVHGRLDNIDFVEDMPQLRSLAIDSFIRNDDLSPVSACPKLKHFSYWGFESELVDLTCFSENAKLESLHLQGVSVKHSDGLENLTHLKMLYLTELEETNIPALSSLPELEELSIVDSDLTEIDIWQTGIRNLYLPMNEDLKTCRISADCAQLENIWLAGTPLPEEEVLGFLELPALKELTVPEGVLSNETLNRFRDKGVKVELWYDKQDSSE